MNNNAHGTLADNTTRKWKARPQKYQICGKHCKKFIAKSASRVTSLPPGENVNTQASVCQHREKRGVYSKFATRKIYYNSHDWVLVCFSTDFYFLSCFRSIFFYFETFILLRTPLLFSQMFANSKLCKVRRTELDTRRNFQREIKNDFLSSLTFRGLKVIKAVSSK